VITSISAAPNLSLSTSRSPSAWLATIPPTTPMTPIAIGSIIAAPAVFDITGEVSAPIRPKARMMR
jgi:hypothetical protein